MEEGRVLYLDQIEFLAFVDERTRSRSDLNFCSWNWKGQRIAQVCLVFRALVYKFNQKEAARLVVTSTISFAKALQIETRSWSMVLQRNLECCGALLHSRYSIESNRFHLLQASELFKRNKIYNPFSNRSAAFIQMAKEGRVGADSDESAVQMWKESKKELLQSAFNDAMQSIKLNPSWFKVTSRVEREICKTHSIRDTSD